MNLNNLVLKNNAIKCYFVSFLFAAVLPFHVHLFIFMVPETLGLFFI